MTYSDGDERGVSDYQAHGANTTTCTTLDGSLCLARRRSAGQDERLIHPLVVLLQLAAADGHLHLAQAGGQGRGRRPTCDDGRQALLELAPGLRQRHLVAGVVALVWKERGMEGSEERSGPQCSAARRGTHHLMVHAVTAFSARREQQQEHAQRGDAHHGCCVRVWRGGPIGVPSGKGRQASKELWARAPDWCWTYLQMKGGTQHVHLGFGYTRPLVEERQRALLLLELGGRQLLFYAWASSPRVRLAGTVPFLHVQLGQLVVGAAVEAR